MPVDSRDGRDAELASVAHELTVGGWHGCAPDAASIVHATSYTPGLATPAVGCVCELAASGMSKANETAAVVSAVHGLEHEVVSMSLRLP
jgi:hypothetical protein